MATGTQFNKWRHASLVGRVVAVPVMPAAIFRKTGSEFSSSPLGSGTTVLMGGLQRSDSENAIGHSLADQPVPESRMSVVLPFPPQPRRARYERVQRV